MFSAVDARRVDARILILERSGIVPGTIVECLDVRLHERNERRRVYVGPANGPSLRHLCVMLRFLDGPNTKVQHPSVLDTDSGVRETGDCSLRIVPVRDQPKGYGHPKGFYWARAGGAGPRYPEWLASACMTLDRMGKQLVMRHSVYGPLFRTETIEVYTRAHDDQWFCVGCRQRHPGSPINTDHALCDACRVEKRISLETLGARFCRTCARLIPRDGYKARIHCTGCEWIRSLRRESRLG